MEAITTVIVVVQVPVHTGGKLTVAVSRDKMKIYYNRGRASTCINTNEDEAHRYKPICDHLA